MAELNQSKVVVLASLTDGVEQSPLSRARLGLCEVIYSLLLKLIELEWVGWSVVLW